MTHDEAFLADIREHPQQDAPRLIYADWLEDNGDPDRGEFIRLQIARARDPSPDPARVTQAWALLSRNWQRWVVPLAELAADEQWQPWLRPWPSLDALRTFERGFVDQLVMDTRRYVEVGDAVQRLIPLQSLRLHGGGGQGAALAKCSTLTYVRKLTFGDFFRNPLQSADMEALAESPHLASLRILRLMRNNVGDNGVIALARSDWLRNLITLDLSDNGLSHLAVAALAAREFPNLRELSLRHNPLGEEALDLLRRAAWLGQLTSLDLSHTGVSSVRVAAPRVAT